MCEPVSQSFYRAGGETAADSVSLHISRFVVGGREVADDDEEAEEEGDADNANGFLV